MRLMGLPMRGLEAQRLPLQFEVGRHDIVFRIAVQLETQPPAKIEHSMIALQDRSGDAIRHDPGPARRYWGTCAY